MAGVVWGLLVARAIPTILYVRARLRLEYGEEPSLAGAIVSHVIALAGAVALGIAHLAPLVVSLVYLVLLTRAAFGLSRLRRPLPARSVGFVEIGWGIFAIVALGFLMRL